MAEKWRHEYSDGRDTANRVDNFFKERTSISNKVVSNRQEQTPEITQKSERRAEVNTKIENVPVLMQDLIEAFSKLKLDEKNENTIDLLGSEGSYAYKQWFSQEGNFLNIQVIWKYFDSDHEYITERFHFRSDNKFQYSKELGGESVEIEQGEPANLRCSLLYARVRSSIEAPANQPEVLRQVVKFKLYDEIRGELEKRKFNPDQNSSPFKEPKYSLIAFEGRNVRELAVQGIGTVKAAYVLSKNKSERGIGIQFKEKKINNFKFSSDRQPREWVVWENGELTTPRGSLMEGEESNYHTAFNDIKNLAYALI